MDFALVAVAEKRAAACPHQSGTTARRVVTGCVEQFPDDDAMSVEEPARAHLNSGSL
jgi:hypothetical protein